MRNTFIIKPSNAERFHPRWLASGARRGWPGVIPY
jgi:hypothetical protein